MLEGSQEHDVIASDSQAGREQAAPPGAVLPPSPLAVETVASGGDVPLPWTTPVATLLAGLIGAATMSVTMSLAFGMGAFEAFYTSGCQLWYAPLVGLAATAMDRLVPAWPAAGRWALGMGIVGVLPNPVIIAGMLGTGRVEWTAVGIMGLHIGVSLALGGAALGIARRSSEGLWWRLPLAGAAAATAGPAILIAIAVVVQTCGGGPTALSRSVWIGVAIGVVVLVPYGGLVGLALAERLHRAIRARERAISRQGP